MKILSIETSCDDTAISLVKLKSNLPEFKVLSNLVSSQTEIHRKWGGIYPTLAKREHQRNLPLVFKKVMEEAGFGIPNIDVIAVTIGPGLDPSLWTGVNFAKTLSCQWNIPIIPVNHIEAHLIISLFPFKRNILKFEATKKDFPAMGLVVSGGHTQLILIKEIGKYKIIGETRDDAAGECFDKTARILGLGYPGGPAIAEQASLWESEGVRPSKKKRRAQEGLTPFKLPRPMINQKNFDFSFSGLKTAVLYRHKSNPEKINNPEYVQSEANEIQQAIIDVLISKTLSAAENYQVKSIIVGGGVISNKELRRQLAEKSKIKIFFPPAEGRTDNALMISVAGYFNRKKASNYDIIKADSNLRI